MTAIVMASPRLRVMSYVFNNDLRHPAVLAQDLASIDVLSRGRLTIAIGAGWNRPEYDAIGLPFEPVAVRSARLAEAVHGPQGLLRRRPVQLRGRPLHDHRLRRRAEARPATPSAAPDRRRRPAHADAGGARGGHRRARAAHPRIRRQRSTQHHLRRDGREDRLGPRGGRRPVRGARLRRLSDRLAGGADRRPARRRRRSSPSSWPGGRPSTSRSTRSSTRPMCSSGPWRR